MTRIWTTLAVERLRRLELYGVDPIHPSEAPRRQQARIIVFHLSDVETCDASCVPPFTAFFFVIHTTFVVCRAVQIFYELFETYLVRDFSCTFDSLRR